MILYEPTSYTVFYSHILPAEVIVVEDSRSIDDLIDDNGKDR